MKKWKNEITWQTPNEDLVDISLQVGLYTIYRLIPLLSTGRKFYENMKKIVKYYFMLEMDKGKEDHSAVWNK